MALLGLAGCSTDDAEEPTTPAVQEEPQDTGTEPAEDVADETTAEDDPDTVGTTEPTEDGTEAEDTAGEPTAESGDHTSAPWAHPVTDVGEPIIDVGDDIVFVNHVVTNHGDPLDLGSLLVAVTARYDDWPYMQGMDSITDSELTEEMGINRTAVSPGTMPDPIIYTRGTGESFSVGESFHHQPPARWRGVGIGADRDRARGRRRTD